MAMKNKNEAKNQPHWGLRILGALGILMGIFLFIGAIGITAIGSLLSGIPIIGSVILTGAIGITIMLIIVGLLILLYGYFLYQERVWAFYLLYLFLVLGLIMSVIQMFTIIGILTGIINLAIILIIFAYMRVIARDVDSKICNVGPKGFLCKRK